MITRKSLADEIDVYDQSIADLNGGKKDCFDAYRDQMVAAGMSKPNIKLEIDAVKAAIKRRRAIEKDQMAVEEKDALVDEVFEEITAVARAPRAAREIIEEFGPEKGNGYAQAKLVETVAKGMQTEAGRAALITAIDIMIDREEAETVAHDADGVVIENLPDPSPYEAHDGEPKPSSEPSCAKSDEPSPLVVGQDGLGPSHPMGCNSEQAVTSFSDDDVPAFLKGKAGRLDKTGSVAT